MPPKEIDDVPNWANAILKLGVFPAIVVWLIYMGTTAFENRLKAIESGLQNQHGLIVRTQDQLGSHSMLTEQWISLTRQICINTARNDAQRTECGK